MFNPDLYVKQNALQKRDAALVLQDVIHRLRWNREEHILDIGCGPGDVTTSVLSNYLPDDATIVGCDISERMVSYAQSKFENKRFNFKQLDIGNSNIWMNWDEESFDKIFSFYCLHWVDNLRQAVENMNNLLKMGGEVVTLTSTSHPFTELFEKLYRHPKWKEHNKVMKGNPVYISTHKEKYLQLLETCGFEIFSAQSIERSYSHANMEEFLDYLESVNPFMKRVSGDQAKELVEDCAKILLEEGLITKKRNETVVHEYSTLTIHARKVRQLS